MKSFEVPVRDIREAALLITSLADYDAFQFQNNIKPDYCNAGGLMVWDESCDPDDMGGTRTDPPRGDWVDWYSEDGEDIGAYMAEHPEILSPVAV